MSPSTSPIFPPWDFDHWHAVNDQVRGGSSTSYLESVHVPSVSSEKGEKAARFHGHLDIDTLGGAGFASQLYRFGPRPLSVPRTSFQGISLTVQRDTPKAISFSNDRAETFTLVLKSTLPTRPPSKPKNPPSPEPASVSYEANFTPSKSLSGKETINIGFEDFKPFYRGREVKRDDPKYQPLKSEELYELSLMCRSGFATQKGDYSVIVYSIEGWKKDKKAERSGVIGVLLTIWTGLIAWVSSFFFNQGRIALHDEEKDPLV